MLGWVLGVHFLPHRSLKRYAQQFLRLHCEFHWKFIEHLLSISVNDKSNSLFGRYAALIAIEELLLADFARRRFMFHHSRVVVDVHIRERVRTAVATQQEGIT